MLTCYTNNGSYSATFIVSKVDGNPLFFPVDGDTFTPASEREGAQIPPYYDPMGPGRMTWTPPEAKSCTISVSLAKSAIGSSTTRAKPTPWTLSATTMCGFSSTENLLRISEVFTLRSLARSSSARNGNGTTTIQPDIAHSSACGDSRVRYLGLQSGQVYESRLPSGASDHRLVVQADPERLQCLRE